MRTLFVILILSLYQIKCIAPVMAQRTIPFAGYQWQVKSSSSKVGPGPNYFSGSSDDIWVDDEGIHLTIKNRNERWYSTEVVLDANLGYGTYIIQTKGRVDLFDHNIVGGLFTWDNTGADFSHREIDIEYAKWGNPSHPTNAQYVVQHCNQCPGCGRCERFQIDLTDQQNVITHFIIWHQNRVQFKSFLGDYMAEQPAQDQLIHEWDYRSPTVPPPGNENVRFNLWLFEGKAPSNVQESEMVISSFAFRDETMVFDWDQHP